MGIYKLHNSTVTLPNNTFLWRFQSVKNKVYFSCKNDIIINLGEK